MSKLARFSVASFLILGTLSGCTTHNAAHSAPAASATSASYPVIFRLGSRHQTLTVTKGPDGPLYSVTDNTGRIFLADSTLDQVSQRDPQLYRWINSALCATSAAE